MEPTPAEQNELVSQFLGITGAPSALGTQLLHAHGWDLEVAIAEYYAQQEQPGEDDDEPSDDDVDMQQQQRAGGRTLGGGPAPVEEPESSSSSRKAPRKKFATLGDLSAGDGGGGDSSDEDDDEPQDLFAGGEKSALAVQNPDDIRQKILEKAKRGVPSSGESESKKSHFTGAARTLGGDDAPSRVIGDTSRNLPERPPRVSRTLHFWNDGFSVDEGDLYRSDDPRNAAILEGIRQGRAPLAIMNVWPGQEVDVEVKQHDTNYVKPKAKYTPFGGTGQRLGSPTPGPGTQDAAPAAAAAPAPTESAPEPQGPTIDESQPTVTLQIRLGDGTRLTSRFNTTNTIGDVYSFVAASSPTSQARPWVLMTTFPSTELSDKSAVLGDLKEYKRGGVVVQKWT
ncbi:hypothetical protein AJ80_01126 [Polytolypa hystricis UAMH7299]|uniref:UBX domain-containing protein n=1 Tax=Polytolypa hystricis (strain UAMH7299) TaxID=1447883 RepID=A0A2B7Z1Q4_POLH7|nr:hypothetical protein AJ80_01126 [Polytolypa hystricis UAMH7299]